MYQNGQMWIAKSGDEKLCIVPSMANRHGLIAGATGTGKTISLKVLAETFSDAGVPVFMSDIKGDLSGMCKPGEDSEKMQERIKKIGIGDFPYKAYPTCFWDVYGEKGLPLRTTISEMGPTLLARLLDLNDTQSDILSIVFKIADDNGWLLLDIKDLRAMLTYVSEHSKELSAEYGNLTKVSVGAISRSIISLEEAGADAFFGEPALDIHDWIRQDENQKGFINVLYCVKLINSPKLYATFMLWMLSELYETMPEVGDCDKPKMVFFFDEAHLLFSDAPKALLEKVTQVVKLIRSKGIGIYFISQNPTDIPDEVLSQLGNRIQHALRAYTPADQKAVKAAAQSFRENPDFKVEEVITELGVGEALVSFLDEGGVPGIVQQSKILPPESFMGEAEETLRTQVIAGSELAAKYQKAIDRESAYEILTQRVADAQQPGMTDEEKKKAAEDEKKAAKEAAAEKKRQEAEEKREAKEERERERASEKRKNAFARVVTNSLSSLGREASKSLIRGIMNTLKK